MPCPISTCGITSVTWPVVSMRIYAFGANFAPADPSGGLAAPTGRWNANTKQLANAPPSTLRRDTFENCGATVMTPSRLLGGGSLLNGSRDAPVGTAAADVARHCRVDVRVVGLRRRY